MVIVWRVYHQDYISGSGMVKAEAQVPSETEKGSIDGNCLEKLPSRLHFRQRDGKAKAQVPSEMLADSVDGNCLEKLPSRLHFRQRDGKAKAQVPSETAAGSIDGNCLEKLPSRLHFQQRDGKSRDTSTIGTGSWKDKMVIVWRVYYQDLLSDRRMVKAEGEVASEMEARSLDGK